MMSVASCQDTSVWKPAFMNRLLFSLLPARGRVSWFQFMVAQSVCLNTVTLGGSFCPLFVDKHVGLAPSTLSQFLHSWSWEGPLSHRIEAAP